jgi:trehalose 6-phosphate phosphatase
VIDVDATVAALTERPRRTALLVDFDGSLAPFVPHADEARPLPGVVDVVDRLVAGLGRVAIVSGRPLSYLMRRLPVDGLVYAGLYGMEWAIGSEYTVDPRVEPYLGAVAAATSELQAQLPSDLVEPKAGISVTLHWRSAPERADEIVALARDVGRRHGLGELRTRYAVELRPPVAIDKSDPTRALVDGFEVAAFAGDDYGDLPAFDELERLRLDGRLRRAIRIGVTSNEAPPDLADAVDVLVDGPPGLLALLARVADEIGEPVRR